MLIRGLGHFQLLRDIDFSLFDTIFEFNPEGGLAQQLGSWDVPIGGIVPNRNLDYLYDFYTFVNTIDDSVIVQRDACITR